MLVKTDLKEKHLIFGSAVLLSTVLLCYGQILVDMVEGWRTDSYYSHGFIIPFLSGYLIWRRKDAFSLSSIDPELKGLPVLMLGLFLLIVGKVGSVDFAMGLSFLIVVLGLSLFLLGIKITQAVLFPISYLVFMIPLPYVLYNDLSFRLRHLSTIFSTTILSVMGIPAFLEGNIINFNQTSLQVINDCSGIHSLISLLTLAVFFAYLTQKSILQRLSLVLLTIPIAIFSNSCRVAIIAILLDSFGPKGFSHMPIGMVIFAVALALIVFCGSVIKRIRW